MGINEMQQQIIEEFFLLEEWFDVYEKLIKLGKQMPVMDEECKNEANLISGCQSRLWMAAAPEENGKIVYHADSDALIVKGIIALLLKVVNHQPPEEIAVANLYFLDAIGLSSHLSPSRANGLALMVERIKEYARAYVY